MSSNNGIYTLPKSEGYLLAFRQLKLLKPYAGILDKGKDRVEFPSNFLHKSTPSLFPSSFYAFSRAFGVQEHYRKIFECVFTAYELKPKPFPTPNDLDVVSHSMKAWESRSKLHVSGPSDCRSFKILNIFPPGPFLSSDFKSESFLILLE